MTPTVAAIQRATAEHFGVPLDRLLGHRRLRQFTRPRQVAMYLACELTDQSTNQIGARFNRDHTTIMHGRTLIHELAERDQAIAKAIDDITKQLIDPAQLPLPLVA